MQICPDHAGLLAPGIDCGEIPPLVAHFVPVPSRCVNPPLLRCLFLCAACGGGEWEVGELGGGSVCVCVCVCVCVWRGVRREGDERG